MSTTQIDLSPEVKKLGRRFGYSIAIGINVVLLIIVQNILDWGWLAFLTEDFTEVVPWISFSLAVSIVANVVYLFNDGRVIKSVGQIGINLISLIVTYQMFTVFPFDFSAYSFDWALVTRIVLILAMVGTGIGALAEIYKLASGERERGKEVTHT
ncbi:MAG: hypothetical protein PVJ28_00635 [Acidimicrobiia bacterium]|jgi:hypothetical protein